MADLDFDWDDDSPEPHINMVPFIDVMLVLVVILLVTTPLMQQSVPLQLPKTVAAAVTPPKAPVVVSINATGEVFWQGQRMENHEWQTALLHHGPYGGPLQLAADAATPYQKIAEVLAMAQHHGISQLQLQTSPQGQP